MAILKTEAVVLERRDFSNTSLIVTFFSEQFGRLSTLAKGARRPKSPFLGTLDLLNRNEIVFYQHTRSSLHTLAHSCVRDHYPGLREETGRIAAGTYIAELVREMTREDERQPEIFDLMTGGLHELARGAEVNRVLFQFEILLLRMTGFEPELSRCVHCGAVPRGPRYAFSNQGGGIVCARCASGHAEDVRTTSPGAVATLRALRIRPIRRGEGISLTPAVARDIKRLLRPYLVHRLEKEPKSLRYV